MVNQFTQCHRYTCFAHCRNNGAYPNNCEILTKVYENNQKCPFFKEKKRENTEKEGK